MEGLVKLMGIIVMVFGVVYFVKPNLMKKMASFFAKDKWIYVGGILSFIIGIVFLRAASQCAISWLVILLGLLAILKGVLVFVLGQQKIKSLLDKLNKKTLKTLRIYALVKITVGVILIYAV
ncbi:hypothetical protein ACFL2J_00735 [Candidatus Omnitrophota bacterium]